MFYGTLQEFNKARPCIAAVIPSAVNGCLARISIRFHHSLSPWKIEGPLIWIYATPSSITISLVLSPVVFFHNTNLESLGLENLLETLL